VAGSSEQDSFAARLTLALNVQNLSRGQLAAAVGVDKSLVSRWLSGQVKPTSYNLARIGEVLATRKPGFNATLWTAPRAEFDRFLGMPASAVPHRASPARIGWRWLVGIAAALVLLLSAWLLIPARAPQRMEPSTAQSATAVAASVAVMPFLNMSGDPPKEYIADGIAEEVLNDLSNTPSLQVAARTSSFWFKGRRADIGEISRRLHVRAVLEGSIRQQGTKIRIVAQLIDSGSGFHLWSGSYDRDSGDILTAEGEIARAITLALTHRLDPRPSHKGTAADVYLDYLQAQYFFNQRTTGGFERALALLNKIVERAPDFAKAQALRAHVLLLRSNADGSFRPQAKAAITRALQLDPDNLEALNTELQRALLEWDWPGALADAHRLFVVGKNSATAHNGLAFFYQGFGFPKQALRERERAAGLNPLSFPDQRNYAVSLEHLGRLQQSLRAFEAAFAVEPHHPALLDDFCVVNARLGRIAVAKSYEAELAAQRPTEGWDDECRIELALAAGDQKKAHELVAAAAHSDTEWNASQIGVLFARTGDLEEAAKWFVRACDRRENGLIWVRVDAITPKQLLSDRQWLALWQRPPLREWARYRGQALGAIGPGGG
jgi:TolB-like protein/transcriptional regulator with XRE-family HTH domain